MVELMAAERYWWGEGEEREKDRGRLGSQYSFQRYLPKDLTSFH
jgi:hypothetical protein